LKPAPFAYDDPRTVDEAVALLAEHGDDAKVLAGGQSLVPLLNFRLARPDRLVDVNRIDELAQLRRREGALRIGAIVRTATLERSRLASRHWPLLVQASRLVGHPQIRSRGTVGGSAAHADAAAELPVAFAALEARFHVRSARGVRVIAAEDFFLGPLTTALDPDELLAEIELPALPPGTGTAFEEYARRRGDFALAGAAAVLTVDDAGECTRARLALLGAGAVPFRATRAEEMLIGERIGGGGGADEAGRVAAAEARPAGDASHRRALLQALVRRAVLGAAERA
jgi:carbon-monoxide dehydrogenase medium subunit/6-hydroxypseudooxynicotine dehydrogenase subunit alpha